MAQCGSHLSAGQISRVTDIVPADVRFRFCVEYLGIDRNQYRIIENASNFMHHDTLYQCIELWKNKMEGEGLDARQELITLLTMVWKDRGWFSIQDMAFLYDRKSWDSSAKRK